MLLTNIRVFSQEFVIDKFIDIDTIVFHKIKEIKVLINNERLFAVYKYDTISRNIYEYYLSKNLDTLYPKYNQDYRIFHQIRHHYNIDNKIDSVIVTKNSSDGLLNNITSITKYIYYKNATKVIELEPYKDKYLVRSTTLNIYDFEKKKIFEVFETVIGGYIYYYQYLYNENSKLKEIRKDSITYCYYFYNDIGLISKAIEGLSELTYFYNEKKQLSKYEIYNDDKGYWDFIYPGRRTYTIAYDENRLIKEITYTYNDNCMKFSLDYSFY